MTDPSSPPIHIRQAMNTRRKKVTKLRKESQNTVARTRVKGGIIRKMTTTTIKKNRILTSMIEEDKEMIINVISKIHPGEEDQEISSINMIRGTKIFTRAILNPDTTIITGKGKTTSIGPEKTTETPIGETTSHTTTKKGKIYIISDPKSQRRGRN